MGRLLADTAERRRCAEAGRRAVAERSYTNLAARLADIYSALPA
jgi:hypothetical protein